MAGEEEQSPTNLPTTISVSGVPAKLRGKAFKWVLRLVGATFGARIVEEVRQNLDTSAGRTRVTMILADEVGRRAIANPETMELAMARLLGDEFRRQENREAVASAAIESLEEAAEAEAPTTDDVDEDWLNIFSRYAEDASSERMQKLWGRVLAGEIRKPGAFSPTALRFIAELDQATAEIFRDFAKFLVGDMVVWGDEWASGDKFHMSLHLQEAGLVSGASGGLHRTYWGTGKAGVIALGKDIGLVGESPEGATSNVLGIFLSKVGRELVTLIDQPASRDLLIGLAEALKKAGMQRLWFGRIVKNGDRVQVSHDELFWDSSAPEAQRA